MAVRAAQFSLEDLNEERYRDLPREGEEEEDEDLDPAVRAERRRERQLLLEGRIWNLDCDARQPFGLTEGDFY